MYIQPPHEVRDQAKFDKLVEAMRAGGWQGRPVLVIDDGGDYRALTGSHRIAAAKAAGIEPEVMAITPTTNDRDPLDMDDDEYAIYEVWIALANANDDDERIEALNRLAELGQVPAEAAALMQAESDLKW